MSRMQSAGRRPGEDTFVSVRVLRVFYRCMDVQKWRFQRQRRVRVFVPRSGLLNKFDSSYL
jgi:hypothetical protein